MKVTISNYVKKIEEVELPEYFYTYTQWGKQVYCRCIEDGDREVVVMVADDGIRMKSIDRRNPNDLGLMMSHMQACDKEMYDSSLTDLMSIIRS